MKATFRRSFTRDLRKVKDQTVLNRIQHAIKRIEVAANLQAVGDLGKMSGTGNFCRIRVGDYRIGVVVEGEVVECVRCLPRAELYRFFP